MRMRRVYLSGPMTGLPDLNFPAFHAAAAQLRAQGLEVVNPAEINVDASKGWEECMRADIMALCGCDTYRAAGRNGPPRPRRAGVLVPARRALPRRRAAAAERSS